MALFCQLMIFCKPLNPLLFFLFLPTYLRTFFRSLYLSISSELIMKFNKINVSGEPAGLRTKGSWVQFPPAGPKTVKPCVPKGCRAFLYPDPVTR